MRLDVGLSQKFFQDKRTLLRFPSLVVFYNPPAAANSLGESAGQSKGSAVLQMRCSLEEVNALTDEMRAAGFTYDVPVNVLICAGVASGITDQHIAEIDGVEYNIRGAKVGPVFTHSEFYIERIQV